MIYTIKDKFVAYILSFISFLSFVGGYLILQSFFNIEMYWNIFLYLSIIYFILLVLIKNLMIFLKIWILYNIIIISISFLMIITFLSIIVMNTSGYLQYVILSFLSIFIFGVIYDFIKIIQNGDLLKDISSSISNDFSKIGSKKQDNEISFSNYIESFRKYKFSSQKSIVVKLMLFLGIPFALIGKGASYFLILGIGEYINGKEYIFSVIGLLYFSFMLIGFFKIYLVTFNLNFSRNIT